MKFICFINRFEFSIAAVNEAGAGPKSPSVIFGVTIPPRQNGTFHPIKTPPKTTTPGYINPPDKPATDKDLGSISVLNLKVVQRSSDTIWLSWSLPSDSASLLCSVNVR